MTQRINERITVRLPKEMNNMLSKMVSRMGLTKNAYVLGLINRELEKEKRKEAKGTRG